MSKAFALFAVTALAEIFGCYAAYMWLRLHRSAWWLLPGAGSLAIFAWLLTLHPAVGAGRTYAAYGGVYITVSLLWLWIADGVRPDRWDVAGALVCLAGVAMMVAGPRG